MRSRFCARLLERTRSSCTRWCRHATCRTHLRIKALLMLCFCSQPWCRTTIRCPVMGARTSSGHAWGDSKIVCSHA